MEKAEQFLTEGFIQGYAGNKAPHKIWLGSFCGDATSFANKDGQYHDAWKAGTRTGGGQEIAATGTDMVTRLYGGGVVKPEILNELCISKKDVTKYLKAKNSELKGRTRLYQSCKPKADGDWRYQYVVISQSEEPPLTMALESITFKGRQVFAHAFIITPIE